MSGRAWTTEDERELARMVLGGMTYAQISAATGRTEQAVAYRARLMAERGDLPRRSGGRPRGALTDPQAARVRRMHADGAGYRRICELTGYPRGAVLRAIRGGIDGE